LPVRPATPNPRRAHWWRSDAWLGALVLLGVMALSFGTDLVNGLERRLYDFASVRSDRLPSERIAIIAIDDQSIANIGRWPWPREVHAQLIDQLAAAGAKSIGHTAFFFEPQTAPGIDKLRELRGLLSADATRSADLPDLGEVSRAKLLGFIGSAERALDADAMLAGSLRRADRVVLPSVFTLGTSPGRPDRPLPPFALRSALPGDLAMGVPATHSQQPIPAIGEAARAVAHLNLLPDRDGAVRQEALLVSFDGHTVPSMALMLAAQSLNLGPADLRAVPGAGVQLGSLGIPANDEGLVLPQFYAERDGRAPFAVDSFHDVLSGKVPASKFADKVVLIGATAAGVGNLFVTPVSSAMSPAAIVAHTTSSILNGHFIAQPAWAQFAALGWLLLVAGYLLAVLPQLTAAQGAVMTGTGFVALLGLDYALLSQAAIWLPTVLPAVALLLGHLALTTRRFLVTEAGKVRADADAAETNRMMGLALQGQGQLDLAFDRLRRVPASPELFENLNHLALDYERKRQFNKTLAVYEHLARLGASGPELQQRLRRARQLAETVMLGTHAAHPGGSLLLGGVEQPMLGRYQVEKELGKGAMGVVYQGRDPKIGRVVAIKTLALSAEFEGVELEEARQRFFREAETAGRLQHPGIVTIFDAGEEHDLAYIAMEFLRGRDLVEHTRVGQLLPLATVLAIGERVARALDYAHQHQVVHRDIKPANIMFDAATDSVKVTDFGIARITDASRTKTGMVFGTPSFMSPEQLAGQPVTGRSDLYSLGVTLFQLLTGELPLRADSLAALMYQIANQAAPDVRSLRPELPEALARLLQQAMVKQPEARFSSGKAMAVARRAVLSASAAQDVVNLQPAAAVPTDPSDAFETTQRQPRSAASAPGQAYTGSALNGALGSPL
jgi:eukaryotic-like serine/threonine-protein kinase